MAVVVFDPTQFKLAFPEFASVTDARLMVLFRLAETILDNTDASLVADVDQRSALFDLIVAHLLMLFGTQVAGASDSGPTGVVGRVESATEGTVSTSLAYRAADSASEAWWSQTQYGAMYWMLTVQYRSFRYVAAGVSGVGHAIDFRNRWGSRVPPGWPPGGV